MRKEIFIQIPKTEIKCDICGELIEKEFRATIRGKRDGKDVIWDFHNACIVKFLIDNLPYVD